ncbi:MAG: hypothetical protein QXO51_03675 [Halobacteria archaeon]
MRGRGARALLVLALVLAVSVSVANATHFNPKTDSCDLSTYRCGSGCTCTPANLATCHYTSYCPGKGGDLPPVPRTAGPELQQAVVGAGIGLEYAKKLRQGGATTSDELLKVESQLESHYEEILKVDPKNFWGNWDYATLRANQKDYSSADRLYHTAVSTLDPATRKEIIANLQIPAVEKWKLSERPAPETSSFLSSIKENLRERLLNRGVPGADQDGEKLTLIGKIAKKTGLYDQYEAYNQCVSGQRGVGGCLVDTVVGPLGGRSR